MKEDIEKAAKALIGCRYVIGLTGAGISVESGIPPFRGPGGLWTKYGEPPMDGYQRFLANPKADWERRLKREGYTRELYEMLDVAKPNPAHHAFAELEKLGILKHLITQNVDNLHRRAGSQKISEIHGNIFLVRCIGCNTRFPMKEINISIESLPPHCPRCNGILKTDGVMFGEPIPRDVLNICEEEVRKCDCILSVGTSAYIYPAAGFPREVKSRGGYLIEVDLYETTLTPVCDFSLRGKAGEILPELVNALKKQLSK